MIISSLLVMSPGTYGPILFFFLKVKLMDINLMEVSWVLANSSLRLLGSWTICLNWKRKTAWNTIPIVVFWTIWKEKNSRTYEGKSTEVFK